MRIWRDGFEPNHHLPVTWPTMWGLLRGRIFQWESGMVLDDRKGARRSPQSPHLTSYHLTRPRITST